MGVIVGELPIWIDKSACRMGVGDSFPAMLEWLTSRGAHSVEIQVLKDNDASWKLYERMGFQLEFRLIRLLWPEYDQHEMLPRPEGE
jgi:RimJ/RimL family protein N-acetyltransferase